MHGGRAPTRPAWPSPRASGSPGIGLGIGVCSFSNSGKMSGRRLGCGVIHSCGKSMGDRSCKGRGEGWGGWARRQGGRRRRRRRRQGRPACFRPPDRTFSVSGSGYVATVGTACRCRALAAGAALLLAASAPSRGRNALMRSRDAAGAAGRARPRCTLLPSAAVLIVAAGSLQDVGGVRAMT